MNKFFSGVAATWMLRRLMEVGGIVGALFAAFMTLPSGQQDAIQRVLTGKWEDVTLGAMVPLGVALWGYIWSFRATTRDQIVVDGQKVRTRELPTGKRVVVEEIANTAVERKSRRPRLLERMFGRRR